MSGRNRVAAALFAIFLGTLGVHKFYLGKIFQGVLYLLFCWSFLPTIIGFIEGLVYLTMTDERFEEVYGYGHARTTAPPMTIKCPQCGVTNYADARRCNSCKTNLSLAATPITREEAAWPKPSGRAEAAWPKPGRPEAAWPKPEAAAITVTSNEAVPPRAPADQTRQRLATLEQLRTAGAITEEEYVAKRKSIIDAL